MSTVMEVNRHEQRKRAFPFHYIPCIGLCICVLEFICFLIFLSFSSSAEHRVSRHGTRYVPEDAFFWESDYYRFGEVKRECQPFLSSATSLKPYHLRNRIQYGLSFVSGDWSQESDGAPLMPFLDNFYTVSNISGLPSPQKLAYFSVKGVGPTGHSMNMIKVTGILTLAISRDSLMHGPEQFLGFQSSPGLSLASIFFEGVYAETLENGGKRVLCMLGTSELPPRRFKTRNIWKVTNVSASVHNQSLVYNDRILLVLWYPKTFTLTSRAIYGEMRSLNAKYDRRWFDKVHMSSQLNAYTNYHFGSEKFVSRACNPYPYQDLWMNGQIDTYKGSTVCRRLQWTNEEIFSVVPTWRCDVNYKHCSKLVPFAIEKLKDTNWGRWDARIEINNVKCAENFVNNSSIARVSAVFRALSPSENTIQQRTTLDENTLSAEGIWNSSSGQLCMVGCLGHADRDPESCDFRICLYIPAALSIIQRSVIFGSISNLNISTDVNFPLSIEMPIRTWFPYPYKYSKIDLAHAFQKRSEVYDYFFFIQKLLLSYPKLGSDNMLASLSRLAEDLSLYACLKVDQPPNIRCQSPVINLEVLSIGPSVGRYWEISTGLGSNLPNHKKFGSSKGQLLLNVSAELRLEIEKYKNMSRLFLEGVYDPAFGKLYLTGCRDVRSLLSSSYDQVHLEDGFDCMIEVKVEYPPIVSSWLVKPIAKMSFSSHRNEDDPFHFRSIKLVTLPILYRNQREGILSRRVIERILWIFTLLLAIVCAFGQVKYLRSKVDIIPFVSLTMLGFQSISYWFQLTTGSRDISKVGSVVCDCGTLQHSILEGKAFQVIDSVARLLVLLPFLLALWIFLYVWSSRRKLTASTLDSGDIPSDKRVLLITSAIHIVGFLIQLYIHSVDTREGLLSSGKHIDPRENGNKLWELVTEFEEYTRIIHDFFLLPQIIGNFIWRIDCKPLSKLYYIGLTASALLQHVHEYIRSPVFDPYFLAEEYVFTFPDLGFYHKFGDIPIAATVILLACIVHLQQR